MGRSVLLRPIRHPHPETPRMPTIHIICEGQGCWPDLKDLDAQGRTILLMNIDAPPINFALLPAGMYSGRASVAMRLELPDGRPLVTETSFRALENAVMLMSVERFLVEMFRQLGLGPNL